MQAPVFVVGPHRCGTSLATKAVALLGHALGDEAGLLPADENNPSGYHERVSVIRLNDRVLRALGGDWSSPPALPAGWQDAEGLAWARSAAAAELAALGPGAVLKDPRFCQTLPLWLGQAPQAQVLLVLRHPSAVAASLLRRDGIPCAEGERFWARCMLTALRQSRGAQRLWWRDSEALLDPAAALRALAQGLGQAVTPQQLEAFESFVDPGQRRAERSGQERISDPRVAGLWQALQAEAWPAEAALDALEAELGPREAQPRTAVFTIATASHLGRAKVLLASVATHQPAWERHLCLADRVEGRFDPTGLGAKLTTAEELDLPDAAALLRRYSAFELCCALKPYMAQRLFKLGYQRVVYFDADIEVYRHLSELERALGQAHLVLTPHRLGALATQAQERGLLRAGAYNLGFFALQRHERTDHFLHWWGRCLAEDCRNDQDHGYFTDQRWMDHAPAVLERVHILRHAGYNVGHWNLEERPIAGDDLAWTAAGQPLAFFHYSSFAPERGLLSAHAPGLPLSACGELAVLAGAYAQRLVEAGQPQVASWEWALRPPLPWPAWKRSLPPYRTWLKRTDLRRHFPQPDGADHGRLWRWYLHFGVREALRGRLQRVGWLQRARAVAIGWGQRLKAAWGPARAFEPGADLVGYLRSENGVGEACRLAAHALEAAGVPFSTIDVSHYAPTTNAIDDWGHKEAPKARRRVSLMHINGNIMPLLPGLAAGRGLFEGQRNIGVWHWELPVLPRSQSVGLSLVHELWAPSRFIEDALRGAAPAGLPVLHMPHAVRTAPDPSLQRGDFGLPEGPFVFSAFFDAHSLPERKNPMGALRAFQRAFAKDDPRAFLLLKSNQGGERPDALGQLREAAHGWPNIRVWDATLSRGGVHRLIQLSDAVLSLHRSEGFGLVMAEAMALGRVAVATGWSGNLDFMDEGNSALVRYKLQKVGQDCGPYEAWQTWAEPDEAHAASLMRRLVDEPAWAAELAAKGQADVLRLLSPQAVGARMRERLQALGAL